MSVHRPVPGMRSPSRLSGWNSRLISPTAQGRVIWNGEIQADQLQHGGQEAFRLTQPQAESQF